jgi:hypothetical protein
MIKPGLAISFWFFYTLGFTIVLPTFLYYVVGGEEYQSENSATEAFFYLGLGVAGWLAVLGLYSRFFIKVVFTDKRRLEKAAEEGITVIATIVEKRQTGTIRDTAILSLTLAFNNLAGSTVELPYELNDGKPYERRFEVGNTIDMRASLNGKDATFVPKSLQVSRNRGMIWCYSLLFLLLLAAAVLYPIFAYEQESQGAGWRFLKLSHPWVSLPLINIGAGVFIWMLLSVIAKASGSSRQSLRMVMYGIRTTGNILHYRQTGMYINEQPQVQFEIEYTDQQGNRQTTVCKNTVSLLDIHKLGTGPKEIMYLPDAPDKIVFYEDLAL